MYLRTSLYILWLLTKQEKKEEGKKEKKEGKEKEKEEGKKEKEEEAMKEEDKGMTVNSNDTDRKREKEKAKKEEEEEEEEEEKAQENIPPMINEVNSMEESAEYYPSLSGTGKLLPQAIPGMSLSNCGSVLRELQER